MRFPFLSWCAAAAAPASVALFLTLACQGPVRSSAIYYSIDNGDGTYTDEYPRRYKGFGGYVGYCAFGGSRGDPWKVLSYDAASTDPAEQILTEIDVITRGREAVTGSNGKDIFESYGLGFPYFEVSAENGNPDDGTWPYFYVKDVVGRCTSTLDFYAVSACADWQSDGAQDEFLLKQDGLDVTSGTPLSFKKRDATFDEGGVEKFRITEELFNLFNVTWDEENQKAVLVGRPVETPEQHQALARLDGAAILMKMECEVTPLPFFPDTSDPDKLWKKVPAALPDGFPETTTVDHCMHFTLDITSVHPVESTDKFWCQANDFTGDEYVALPSDILLDAIPDSNLGMKDIVNLSPLAAFDEFNGIENVRGGVGVPPIYSPNYACSRPPIGAGPQWPNNGCICFEPENAGEVSYYDMIDAKDSLPSSSFGYRTAVNTSVTSGVTVAAWVKLGDTSGPPWNYTGPPGEKSGQQTSLIFTRGQLASYGMGYNLGVGKDNGFRFEVVVKGCPFYTNGTNCVNDCNESDTDTTYDGSYECCETNFPGFDDQECMGTPGGIGPQRLTLESDVNLYCDDSNPYCDDYIANWHYIVGTYDAELGRASFYVDNKLVKAKDVNLAFTKRYHRDIKWGNDGLASVTRVGNGYDSVSKNFFGCTAGISVIAGASRSFPEACVIISTCAELQDLLDLSARTGDKAKICSSTTPIDCRATSQSGSSSIVLEEGIASAKCVSQDLAEERCVLDLSPVAEGEGYSYSSILLRKSSTLIMEGFEFRGIRGNSRVVYHQDSSSAIFRGCAFLDNVGVPNTRGVISRDYIMEPDCGELSQERGNIVYENCYFKENVGELVYVQASILTMKNSIVVNNTMPSSGDKTFGFVTLTSFSKTRVENNLTENLFLNNDASEAKNGTRWFSRGIPTSCRSGGSDELGSDCQSILQKTDLADESNYALGNADNRISAEDPCENGIWYPFPKYQCQVLNNTALSDKASLGLDAIYPLPELSDSDLSSYMAVHLYYSPTCEPSSAPSSNPSNMPSFNPSTSSMPVVSDNKDVVEIGASSAKLHIVDQSRTLCPEKNGKRRVSCWQSLDDVEIKVFDRAEMQGFDKKDADVYFEEAPDYLAHVDVGQSFSIAFGSGSYVAVARYVHDGEDIFASKFFDQDAGELDFKFMLHVNKRCNKKRRFGASTLKSRRKKKRRQLEDQVCEDLTIVYPQYSIWNSTTEVYPMDVVSNSSCAVDVCAVVPQGYAFMAVLDENDIELPINGDCVHTLSGGEHVILLFQLQINIDAEPDVVFDVEVETAGTTGQRFLRNLKRRQRIEIKGYRKSTKGSAQKELHDKLKRKGGGKGKLFN